MIRLCCPGWLRPLAPPKAARRAWTFLCCSLPVSLFAYIQFNGKGWCRIATINTHPKKGRLKKDKAQKGKQKVHNYLQRVDRSLGEGGNPAGEILSWDPFTWGARSSQGRFMHLPKQDSSWSGQSLYLKPWLKTPPMGERAQLLQAGELGGGRRKETEIIKKKRKKNQPRTQTRCVCARARACVAFELPTDCHREKREGGRERNAEAAAVAGAAAPALLQSARSSHSTPSERAGEGELRRLRGHRASRDSAFVTPDRTDTHTKGDRGAEKEGKSRSFSPNWDVVGCPR